MRLFGYKIEIDAYDPKLDYGNLNVLLQKQVAELESMVVDLNKEIDRLENAQLLK